jgi:DNA-binding GntR family transcriptional regulator
MLRLAIELDQQQAATAPAAEPSKEDLFEVHRLHMRFHLRLAEASGCDELYGAIERNQILVFNWLFDSALKQQAPPPDWHKTLTEALNTGDPEAADAAMRRHTRFRMEEVLESLQTYFHWDDLRMQAYRGKNGPRGRKAPVEPAAPDSSIGSQGN